MEGPILTVYRFRSVLVVQDLVECSSRSISSTLVFGPWTRNWDSERRDMFGMAT